MKRIILFTLVLVFTFTLSACATSTPAAGNPVDASPTQSAETGNENPESAPVDNNPVSVSISYDYEGALSNRLLLALGSLKLSETDHPLTKEQAPQMLMLWQALNNLTQSGTSAEEEVSALLSQIELAFSPEQIASINAMKLTQTELQAWAQENGITVGTGTGLDGGTGQGVGQGQSLSPEEKATKQAENGMTGSTNRESGLSAAITSALINYLEGIQ